MNDQELIASQAERIKELESSLAYSHSLLRDARLWIGNPNIKHALLDAMKKNPHMDVYYLELIQSSASFMQRSLYYLADWQEKKRARDE